MSDIILNNSQKIKVKQVKFPEKLSKIAGIMLKDGTLLFNRNLSGNDFTFEIFSQSHKRLSIPQC